MYYGKWKRDLEFSFEILNLRTVRSPMVLWVIAYGYLFLIEEKIEALRKV